jgi:ABC-type lipoprotein export system ATPase subunit
MHIELQEISKSYTNNNGAPQRDVLSGISMNINSGDTIAIVGPSGSGKSTLLNIMGTLDAPTTGKVLFDGTDITQLQEKALSQIRNQHIGFVFQMHHLLPQLNLLENVLIPLIPGGNKTKQNESVSRAMELLSQMGLADKIHQFPGQLSVGECQRTAVVRALINEPKIILADEPTGSLDHDAAEQLCDILLNIRNTYSLAMVVVTHSSELAKRMDTTYKLTNGKLIKE